MPELSAGRSAVKIGSQVAAAIFDSLDKIDENRFAYTKVQGKEDVIDLAIGENGRLDPRRRPGPSWSARLTPICCQA